MKFCGVTIKMKPVWHYSHQVLSVFLAFYKIKFLTQNFILHETWYITSTDYLEIAELIEAGSMMMHHLHLNYNINTEKVTYNSKYGTTDWIQ